MNQWMKTMLESKRQERGRLRSLPFDEKIALLERMRDRARAIAASPLAQNQPSYSQPLPPTSPTAASAQSAWKRGTNT